MGSTCSKRNGFTIAEVVIAITILAILGGISLPLYNNYNDRLNVGQAITDIKKISVNIQRYFQKNNGYPETLAEVNMEHLKDPWGKAYQYLNIQTADKDKPRQDRSLKPFNSDYDLYSSGKDGISKKPITAAPSHDDIIRANNGGYVGLAEEY